MYLFIDTTKAITVGLLNEDYEWLSYNYLKDAKGSALIHKIIFDQIQSQGSVISDIKGLIQVAGPGSYTGMRVSEGIAQIFDWQNFETFSFYHYEVPFFLGVNEGVWFSNAFKGEYFVCSWSEQKNKTQLIKKEDIDLASQNVLYTGFEVEDLNVSYQLTSHMIQKNAKALFKNVVENNLKKPLYYYRTLDEEYSKK
jgi:tRNA threonylcarbamoyladenosine biosynthesis protein TsaB